MAKIEEEKQAEQKEREQMQTNFEQHQQLELKQQEEKKKVGFKVLNLALCMYIAQRVYINFSEKT